MAVFRFEDEELEEGNEVEEGEEVYYDTDSTSKPQNEDEKNQLDHQRQQFNSGKVDYNQDDSLSKERKALDKVDKSKKPPQKEAERLDDNFDQDEKGFSFEKLWNKTKSLKSKANRKIFLGLGIFLMPTLVGLGLFLIALQAGIALEHINRVTTGLRFGTVHLQLSRRFNHVRREHVRLTNYQTVTGSQFAPYQKTTLGSRLLGISPDKIYSHLNTKGYSFEYSILGGSATAKGRKTLTRVIYPDGTSQKINSSAEARDFLNKVRFDFDDTEISRFRASRASFLLAKQVGIPFLRFKTLIDGLKDGSLKDSVRGSPSNFVQQRVNENILDNKQRLANKLPRLQNNLSGFKAEDLVESTRADAVKNIQRVAVIERLRDSFNPRQTSFSAAAALSVSVGLITIACVLREIGSMIRDAFKMKVRGLQDNATTLITTTSQIKAGDMSGEVVADMTQRFRGFETSANYQVGVGGKSVEKYAGVEGSDFSEEFSPTQIFDGWSVPALISLSDLLKPANFLAATSDYVKANAGILGGLIDKVGGLVGAEIGATIGVIESGFKEACQLALNSKFQFGLLITEILVVILATVFSGGLGGGVAVGAGQVVKQITGQIAKLLILELGVGIALDILLFDYLLPNMVVNATGLDTALINDEGLHNGARNYAATDYGMHYLSLGESLNSGGSQVPIDQAVAQTQSYLAQQRLDYADKGLLNNIFALDNPYSLATSLMVTQNGAGSWREKGQFYFANLADRLNSSFKFFQPVYAQEGNNNMLAELLYPGQTTTIGFNEKEMSGENPLFNHEINTLYVENNFDYLRDEYSACLGIDTSEFLLAQSGNKFNEHGAEYYPEKCDSEEARRYKTYYQDCTLIEGIRLWGSNSSPMFSSRCDHLLSTPDQDILNEAAAASALNESSEDGVLTTNDGLNFETLEVAKEPLVERLNPVSSLRFLNWPLSLNNIL